MCLLVKQKLGNSFSDDWLKDFFRKNDDGIGVMWAENNVLYTQKLLPKNEQEMIDFYREAVDGKECAFHLRMRTHGDTDLENCHPYKVFGEDEGYPLYLMHNGVLSTGNAKDPSKSDTWHYIQDIIRPALMADKTQFMAPWFKTLIEDHIGRGNKFVMMDAYGNVVTFNKSSGVDWDGNWMSNTYAWSANKAGLVPGYSKLSDWGDDFVNYGSHGGVGYGYGYNPNRTAASDGNRICNITPITVFTGSDPQGKLPGVGDIVSQNDNDSPNSDLLKRNATHDEIADALDFADMLFAAFGLMEMEQAIEQLNLAQAANMYLDDPDSAWTFFEEVEQGIYTEAGVFEKFGVEPQIELEDNRLVVGMQ
jgi:hypothetical protein